MIRKLSPAVAALAVAAALTMPAFAADVGNAGNMGKADATRATGIIGKTVTNRMDQKIGIVDDLLIARDGRITSAVLSVGGFLGIGDKLVTVPFKDIEKRSDALVVNRSSEQLKALPEFKYQTAANTVGPRDTYMRTADQRMSEWDKKMADWKRSAKNASSDAGKKLDSAWAATKEKFAEMKDATGDGWDRAKTGFDKAWNDLQGAWKDATS